MRKRIVFKKLKRSIYKIIEESDQSMFTLSMFLGDGLSLSHYIDFLKNDKEDTFFGNVSNINKKGNMAIVTLDESIIPDSDPFITTIENLIIILKEYRRLQHLEVDTIEIVLEDDNLSISGN